MDRDHGHKVRVRLVAGFVLLLFAALLGRLYMIQAVDAAWYGAMARGQHQVRVALSECRGTIRDCRGRELAVSAPAQSLFADPRLIVDKQATAHRLAHCLGLDEQSLLGRLEKRLDEVCVQRSLTVLQMRKLRQSPLLSLPDEALTLRDGALYARPASIRDARTVAAELAPLLNREACQVRQDLEGYVRFAWVKRKVTEEERKRVMQAGELAGLGVVPEYERTYAQGKLAPQLIGLVNIDGVGLEGLELAFEGTLAGRQGFATYARDATGRYFSRPGLPRKEPERGADVELTLDVVVQSFAEAAVDEACELWAPKGVAAVVIDPRTGDLLAAASRPTFDPNDYAQLEPKDLKSRTRARYLVDWMEPGSVMKPFVLSGVLAERLVSEKTVIFCENGAWSLGRRTFHDAHAYGHLSVAMVIIKSSNIGAAKLGLKLGAKRLHATLHAFGFGQPTGLELPGENPGRLWPLEKWRPGYSVPSVSVGQEVCVNMLQMALAYAAIANDGVLMRPRLVRRIVHADGRVEERPPRQVRRVIPASVARRVRRVLCGVVEGGTGRRAQLEGYSAAGKTGTAQKTLPGGGYSHTKLICSYVGMAPAETPRLVVMVSVDEPLKRTGGRHYGGTVAAPVVARILEDTLTYLGVEPEKAEALERLGIDGLVKRRRR